MFFKVGSGDKVNLCLQEARVVAVACNWNSRYHCYSILIGKYFLATKNFSRKTWKSYEEAGYGLENLNYEKNILVTKNLKGKAQFKEVEQGWVKYDIPENKYHTIEYYNN